MTTSTMFFLVSVNIDTATVAGQIKLHNLGLETSLRHFGRVAQQIKVLGVLFPQKSVGLIGIWS